MELNVLEHVVGLQRANGLRYNDYDRYRQYCTRRLHRLRKRLKIQQGKRKFEKKEVAVDMVKDVDYLTVPLLSAERAWAAYQFDKQLAQASPRKLHHGVSRLRKGVFYAKQLQALVAADSVQVTKRTQDEINAYVSFLEATLLFERKEWSDAKALLGKSAALYAAIAKGIADENIQHIYAQRINEISATVRFCEYNLEGTQGLTPLFQAMGIKPVEMEAQSSTTEAPKELSWLGTTVALPSRKIQVLFSTVHTKAEALKDIPFSEDEKQVLERYDDLFVSHMDTLAAITEILEMHNVSPQGLDGGKSSAVKGSTASTSASTATGGKGGLVPSASEEEIETLRFIQTYARWHRLNCMLSRNLWMINRAQHAYFAEDTGSSDGDGDGDGSGDGGAGEKNVNAWKGNNGRKKKKSQEKPKPEDLVRLFDIVNQNLADLHAIDMLQDDDDFPSQYAVYIPYLRSMRCFFIAESFRLSNKVKEALLLYTRSEDMAKKAHKKFKKTSDVFNKPLAENLAHAANEIRTQKCGMQAAAYLQGVKEKEAEDKGTATTEENLDKPLSETPNDLIMDQSVLRRPLVPFPPAFETMASRPLFFDMGASHLEFPTESLAERARQQSTVGAVTSMLSSWWGGGKSDA